MRLSKFIKSHTWLRTVYLVFIIAAYVAFSISGALLAISCFGTRNYRWQAFEAEFHVYPSLHGQTRLILTPLGEVRADTHNSPIVLQASLRNISFDRLKKLVFNLPSRENLESDLHRSMETDLRRFAYYLIWIGAIGGLVGPIVVRPKRWWAWLFAPLIGSGTVAGLLWTTFHTYNPGAFKEATYIGSLRQAGPVLALARNAFDNAQALRERLKVSAAHLNELYDRLNVAPDIPDDNHEIRILHVSDIHNNTAAVSFIRDLAGRFHVAAIIDTGDLSDFGSSIETNLSQGLGTLSVPYLFVAGNHDSQTSIAAIRKNKNAIILNGQTVTVAGLRFLGYPDPSSARSGVGDVNTPDASIVQAAAELSRDYSRTFPKPDIICVHNPKEADNLAGRVPVILCGHLHRASITTDGISVICNAGTSGGAGVRYLNQKGGVPLTAAVLNFSQPVAATGSAKAAPARLLSIDQIALDGSLDEYSITRRIFPRGPEPVGRMVNCSRRASCCLRLDSHRQYIRGLVGRYQSVYTLYIAWPFEGYTVGWYWDDDHVDSGYFYSETVSCTTEVITSTGETLTVTPSVSVNVWQPKWTANGTAGKMCVYHESNPPDYMLRAMYAQDPDSSDPLSYLPPGMYWEAWVSDPTTSINSTGLFGNGTLAIVQIIKPDLSYTAPFMHYDYIVKYDWSLNGGEYLDISPGRTVWDYGWKEIPAWLTLIPKPQYYSSDSPLIDLTTYNATTAHMGSDFDDYLMYLPPGSSQFVPIATYFWKCNAANVTKPPTGWGNFTGNPAGTNSPSARRAPRVDTIAGT